MRHQKPDGALVDIERLPCNTRLWVIYGQPNFPHMICCIIKPSEDGPVIWSYTDAPRFRGFTCNGELVTIWRQKQRMAYFFPRQDTALEFIAGLTLPRS